MAKKDILIEEDLELGSLSGTAPVVIPPRLASIFPALTHRNFQLYIVGQGISVIGFWLQQVGLGWQVFNLTHSAFWVGTVAAIGGLPFLFFTTFAGVFIDKANKQKLLIATQTLELTLAAILGIVILIGSTNLAIIIIIAFLTGVVGAFDIPARMTFLIEMVGREDLASATALNNSIFNVARFIGPAIAGILIAFVGVGWTFIANSLSFIPAIIAISQVKPVFTHHADMDIHPFKSLKEGISFSFTHPKISYFIIFAFLTAILIWPYQTLMPVIAGSVFNAGASGLGSLLSAAGLGSLLGALIVSSQSKRENKIPLIATGTIVACSSLVLLAIFTNFYFAHFLLFTTGFGIIMQVSTISTLVQLNSPDAMRGRIMAVFLTMFVGMMPIGNALAGFFAQKTSPQLTLAAGALILLFINASLYFKGVYKRIA